jgi:hypothetical protein
MSIDTKAVRALADERDPLTHRYWWAPTAGQMLECCDTLRQCADELDALHEQNERQSEALTILDGFTGPPPTKDQWDGICALALALKEALKC